MNPPHHPCSRLHSAAHSCHAHAEWFQSRPSDTPVSSQNTENHKPLKSLTLIFGQTLRQKLGQVIVVSSVAGLKAYPGGAIYGDTKWFVRDLMEVLRMESAMEGSHIRTSTIYPAAVGAELLRGIAWNDPRK